MIPATAPSTAAEATHAEDYSAFVDEFLAITEADYIPRRALARHVEVFDSEFDQWIAENAAWFIRCVRVHPNRPVGAHVAWGVSR